MQARSHELVELQRETNRLLTECRQHVRVLTPAHHSVKYLDTQQEDVVDAWRTECRQRETSG